MKVLELFSGSKVLSETFEGRGHDTFTVDKEEEYKPDLAMDILELKVSDFPEEFRDADVVWASPPCTTFSVASMGTHWNSDAPATAKCYQNLALAKKSFEVIEDVGPDFWFVENPVGKLRKQHFVHGLRRVTLTYCQYGEDRMKPTDIWTNTDWTARPTCDNGDDCHESAPRGSRTGTQGRKDGYERSKLPVELCDEIARYCEGEPVNNHKLTEEGLQRITESGGGDGQ